MCLLFQFLGAVFAADFSVRQKREVRALNALADLKRKSTTMVGADSGPEGFMKVSMTQLQEVKVYRYSYV